MKGGLLINKPKGITSHDVIYAVRRHLANTIKVKVGHSGTLDPFATGVLLVLLGPAVRLQDELHLLPKTYRAEITLGANTDTNDVTGAFTSPPHMRGSERGSLTSNDPTPARLAGASPHMRGGNSSETPSESEILSALDQINHQTTQIPPAYSAIKLKGKKMYELARKGEIVEQKPRNIKIHEIILESYSYPTLTISVTCSTGTYIRSIARDMGAMLGTGGYCSQLERTAIGNFTVQHAIRVEDLPENINSVLITLEQLTEHLQSISFSDFNVAKLKNGGEVGIEENTPQNTPLVLKNIENKVFGIGIRQSNSPFITPKKIFL